MICHKSKFHINMRNLIAILKAFLLFNWLVLLRNTNSYYSVYILCALVGAFCFFDNYRQERLFSKKKNICIVLASMVFSACVVFANYELFFPLNSTNILNIPLCAIGGCVIGREILLYGSCVFPLKADCEKIARGRKSPLKIFFITFSIIAVIDLLYLFFYTYPGVASVDSIYQIRQSLTNDYNNHHPFWHTINVKIIFEIALSLFNDINIAVLIYCILNVLFMAFAFSYAVTTLYQCGIPKKVLAVVLLVFALMPYFVAYSVIMWKDVSFAIASLIMVVSLYRLLKDIGSHKLVNYVTFVGSGLAFCLWRSNGKYAFFVFLVLFVLMFRKKHIKISAIMAVVFIVSVVLSGPVLAAMNIKQTQYSERLSIPAQQVARVITAGCELTEEEEEQLSKIMDIEKIPEIYKEYISDNVKGHIAIVGDEYLQEHKLEYLKLWIKLGCKYPQYYAAAYVEQTKGYWNGGYEYPWYSTIITENDLGIEEGEDSKLANTAANIYFWAIDKQEFAQPLRSIGLHVWLLGGLFVVTFVSKRKEEMLLTVPVLLVVATLLIATPVFCEFRYAYSVFTTLPFILGVTLCSIKNGKTMSNETEQEITENEQNSDITALL